MHCNAPTPTGLSSKAQGRRASRRTLGYAANNSDKNPNGVSQCIMDTTQRNVEPRWGSMKFIGIVTQGALLRPWALEFNAFGVKTRRIQFPNQITQMALHPKFPIDPHVILDPAIRWFPADEALR